MKTKLLLFSVFTLILAFPLAAAAVPDIEVSPTEHDFGNVAIDSPVTTIITVSNVGGHDLVVNGIDFQVGSNADFVITGAPSVPVLMPPPNGHVSSFDIEVTFSPTTAGFSSATLLIYSNDSDEGVVQVVLSGVGFQGTPPVSPTIGGILAFFDASVADGTLCGYGPGNSADGRRDALRNKIKAAGDMIDDGVDACEQLLDSYQRCDGLPRPPEFVACPAAATLAQMILELMGELGCE